MRQQVITYLDNAITVLLFVVAFFTPLLFFNQMTEFYEMPKLLFLFVSTIVLLGLWIFSWILKGKVVISRTPLDIPLLLLLVIILLSTYFSTTRYAAIYGNFPRVHGSAVSWVTYILLYFITSSHLRNFARLKTFLYVLYASGALVALITLLSFFNLFLPFDFARAVNFTTTGSSFSTIAFLLLLLPLPLLSLTHVNKYFPAPFALAAALLFSVVIVLIGNVSSFVCLLVVYGLCLFLSKPRQLRRSFGLFLVPVAVIVLTLLLAYSPLHLPGSLNIVNQLETNFPKEIQLPFATSWKVSVSAFRDAPFIGTGPSSYLFNFTNYKPVEFNLQKFWNFTFDTAHDEFLQVLGTLGFFGLLFFLIFCIVVINNSRRNLVLRSDAVDAQSDTTHVLLPALSVTGLLSVILFAIHATTLVSVVVTFFLLAVLMMSQRAIRDRVMELSMGIKASTSDNKQFDLFPIIIFVVFFIAAVPTLFRTYTVVVADYYHRQALLQATKNGTLTYQYLQQAESLNPVIDLYRVDMAQTNFALANALAAQKGPSAQNPNGTLTDQDKTTIQTLLSQSINEGRVAVALSPRSSRNMEVLAAIYQNITGVAANALAFALDAYGQAIQKDPLNPALRVSVGAIYYAAKNYDMAIRFFTDAANLKPDYATAYYSLAVALRDKGDLQNATLVAQQTVALLATDTTSPDYQTAVKLLNDLKAKGGSAGGSAQSSIQSPTASSSALQNPSIGNVTTLNNPPSVTPVPSVKPNPEAKVPQPTPTTFPVAYPTFGNLR